MLIIKMEAKRRTGLGVGFLDPKAITSDLFHPARSHLLNLPKRSTNWEPNIQLYEFMGVILIETTTDTSVCFFYFIVFL